MPSPARLGADKIVQLERELAAAVQDRDLDRLERILAEEFTLATGRPGAETRDRREYVAIAAERYTVRSHTLDSIEPTVYGHVAVARVQYRQDATLDGDDRTGRYLFTDVWVRRRGRWQLATRHSSFLGADRAAYEGNPRPA